MTTGAMTTKRIYASIRATTLTRPESEFVKYVVPAFVSAIVMASPAFAAFHITNGTGCQKWETTDKLNRMILEGDQIAADRLYRAAIAIGECRHFTAGQRVYVVEWHFFSQSVLFRPEGE